MLARRSPARPVVRLTIIVADDDADMRAYISHALRGRAVVYEAPDGEEALRLARSLLPALVVADVHMPGLDGFALCHALKADVATAAIPVLLVSGETRAPPADCANGFLAKPFNAAGLRASVGHLIPLST